MSRILLTLLLTFTLLGSHIAYATPYDTIIYHTGEFDTEVIPYPAGAPGTQDKAYVLGQLGTGDGLAPIPMYLGLTRGLTNEGSDLIFNAETAIIATSTGETLLQRLLSIKNTVTAMSSTVDEVQIFSGTWGTAFNSYVNNAKIRNNHTGTQLASTISDFATSTRAVLATVASTGSYNDLTNKPSTSSVPIWAFASTTRSLNSNFTISTSSPADVVYSISASWSISALISGSGTAFLEYSLNGGSTWDTVSQVSKSLTLLTIGGADEMNLSGKIPANALVRIRTTSSNMTISFVRSQEVITTY